MSGTPLQGSPFAEIDRVKALVGKHFTIYETRSTPYSLIFLVNVDPARMEAGFDALAQEMWPLYYIPQLRLESGEHVLEVVRRPKRKAYSGVVNWIMLGLTVATTLFAGAFLYLSYRGGSALHYSDFLWGGLLFALPLLLILSLHELAHFVMARKHHVEASLPFFMPMPPPFVIFGTFGAFISLREPIPNRKALMDIGVSGPLAGFAVAIPVTLAGFLLSGNSPVLPLTNCGPVIFSIPYGDLILGPSAIWYFLSLFFPVASGNLNPLAIAGWVGLLVTAINLLPAGQLDGGHVFRALLGKRSVWLSMTAVVVLLGLGLFYPGWILFAFLVLFLGIRHPPPLNDISPLDMRRKLMGVGAVIVLVGGFALIPIASPTGDFAHQNVVGSPYSNSTTNATLAFTISNQDFVSHAYGLSVTIAPLNLSNQTFSRYNASLNWTISYTGPGGTARSSGTGVTLSLPEADLDGGARGHVTILLTDPVPAHFTAEFSLSEACSSVQHLAGGSTQTFSIFY